MSQDRVNPHYIPAAALKRFADDLGNESSTNKFLQLNRERVNSFIDKPYTEGNRLTKDSPNKESRKTTVAGVNKYDFDASNSPSFIHLQSQPAFQQHLGARSRFGDGDGSFFDRWLSSDAVTSSHIRDKDGLPVMKFSLNHNQAGFKKLLKDHNEGVDTRKARHVYVKPYTERRIERLKMEKEKDQSPPNQSTGLTSPEVKCRSTESELKLPAIQTLSAAERENYFGLESRTTFFDYYRQLTKQHHNTTLPVSAINTARTSSTAGGYTARSDASNYMNLLDIGRQTDHSSSPLLQDHSKSLKNSDYNQPPKFAAKLTSDNEVPDSPGNFSLQSSFRASDQDTARSRISSRGTGAREGDGNADLPSRSSLDLVRETYSRLRPRTTAPSKEERQMLLDHLFAIHPSEQRANRPASARTKYLTGCLEQNILPRPALILRKEYTSYLNLASLGMGNDLAIILAEALDSVPLLEGFCIADNGLDDSGLVPIVNKLCACKSLKLFDLSNNKVDRFTAEALRRFISSADCQLTVLMMQNANVDDYEAFHFMETIAVKNTIEDLDLSHNLLGSHEMAIKRSHITAGESIARLLKADKCSLKTLKLAWNTIRFHSAVALVESLKYNNTLTYLDVSYNGLGVEGGETLGNVLHSNNSLTVLKIAQNNITSRPCFTIFSGIKSCESLEEVDLSFNPIGEEGARGLLTLNITYGYRVRVDIKNCSVRIKDTSCWFQPLSPKGDYTLDLSKPYERAIVFELMRTVVRDPELIISKFKYFNTPGDMSSNIGTDINPQIAVKPLLLKTHSGGFQSITDDIDSIRELFRETADRIFQQYDTDESGSLDRDELTFILEQLGLEGAWQWADKLLSIYDTDNSGRVEEDEFISFLLDFKSSYENDMNFVNKTKYIYDGNSPGEKPYVPPEQGLIVMKVETNKQYTANKFVQILSCKQVESLLDASKAVPDSSTLLELALSSNKWTINEAQAFFQAMVRESGSVLNVLLKVLPHMASALDARMLIAYVTNHQFEHIQALKVLLGPLYRIYIGIPNGFYSLNLADQRDKEALTRLVETSLQCAEQRKANKKGDTSQDGTSQSFRNSYYENVRTTFTEDWLRNLPEKGRVEFDFVALLEVNMKEVEISNFRLFRLLSTLGIVQENKRKRIFAKLSQYKVEGRQASKGTGLKKIELGRNAAKEVAAYIKQLYDNCVYAVNSGEYITNRQPRSYSIDVSKEETSMLEGKRRQFKANKAASGNNAPAPQEGNELLRLPSQKVPRKLSRRSTQGSVSSIESGTSSLSTVSNAPKSVVFHTPEEVLDNEERLFKIPESDSHPTELGEINTMDIYGHHIKEMIDNNVVERELIAIRVLDALETVLAGRYITSTQLGLIVERFPFGNMQLNEFSTYRVELIISLFSRVVDLINFEYVLKELDNTEMAMVLFRIGWLNVWNPLKPEGHIVLDLSRREERQVARMLITLNYVETGETWLDTSYTPSSGGPPEENWKLPISWYAEETLPSVGILGLQYFSGKGVQLQGCEASVASRMSLMSVVLAQPYAEDIWHGKDAEVDKAEKMVQKLGFRLSFIAEGQVALLKNAKSFLDTKTSEEPLEV